MGEATINGSMFTFNGWFKWLVGILTSFIMATTAYAYIVILPKIADNVIENDKLSRQRDIDIEKRVIENRILIAELSSIKADLTSIKENQQEFKSILKRTTPYERKP